MLANRRRDTGPELAVRSRLHARGLRYRVDYRVGRGRSAPRPDIAFTRAKLAIFIDGCFWHRCPVHGTTPATNASWWKAKLQRNVDRDRANDRELRERGWAVMRFWEHEPSDEVADAIEGAYRTLTDRNPVKTRATS